jgi:hypothetical protein
MGWSLRGPIVARCLASKKPANSPFRLCACSRSHERDRVIEYSGPSPGACLGGKP